MKIFLLIVIIQTLRKVTLCFVAIWQADEGRRSCESFPRLEDELPLRPHLRVIGRDSPRRHRGRQINRGSSLTITVSTGLPVSLLTCLLRHCHKLHEKASVLLVFTCNAIAIHRKLSACLSSYLVPVQIFSLSCVNSLGGNNPPSVSLTRTQIKAEPHVGRKLNTNTQQEADTTGDVSSLGAIYPSVSWVSLILGRRKEGIRAGNESVTERKAPPGWQEPQEISHLSVTLNSAWNDVYYGGVWKSLFLWGKHCRQKNNNQC